MRHITFVFTMLVMASCSGAEKKADTTMGKMNSGKMMAAKMESKPSDTSNDMGSNATGEPKTSVKCVSGSDERTIAHYATTTGGCEVQYTKFGEMKVVSSASNNLEYCDEVVDRIRGKLENVSFNCQ